MCRGLISLFRFTRIAVRKEASGPRLLLGLLWDHEVGGSNPLTPTIFLIIHGLLATGTLSFLIIVVI